MQDNSGTRCTDSRPDLPLQRSDEWSMPQINTSGLHFGGMPKVGCNALQGSAPMGALAATGEQGPGARCLSTLPHTSQHLGAPTP